MHEIVWILAGLVGLWFGSDFAVESAQKIAKKLGVSELIIGLTITSIGTSLPEIFTNVMAGLSSLRGTDASNIAVGNIIGSNLGQITIILGLVGFIATLYTTRRSLRRDGAMMFLALFLMFFVSMDGFVSRMEGVTLVIIYVAYLLFLASQEKLVTKVRGAGEMKTNVLLDLAYTLIGIAVVVYSANLIVENGVSLAQQFNISEYLIGIFVGLGTSIPELVVSLKAIVKHAGRLSLGNLIGSNITDPLLSFGLGASIAGVNVSASIIQFDFVYWMVATAVALLLLFNHMNLSRKESSILILMYLFFIYLRVVFFQ